MRTRLVLAVLLLLAWASPRCAGADPVPSGTKEAIITLDPAQTRIDFTLPGALHTTHGSFRLQSGTISVHPRSGKAGGKIVVDAASGDTGNSMRDARMKDNILEVGPYPEIVFVPKTAIGHLDPQGVFHGQLNGTLSLHGGSHEISMDTQGRVEGGRVIATAHFAVPYVQWGLKDPSMLFLTVSKSVDIEITAAGLVTWIRGAAASQPRDPVLAVEPSLTVR